MSESIELASKFNIAIGAKTMAELGYRPFGPNHCLQEFPGQEVTAHTEATRLQLEAYLREEDMQPGNACAGE